MVLMRLIWNILWNLLPHDFDYCSRKMLGHESAQYHHECASGCAAPRLVCVDLCELHASGTYHLSLESTAILLACLKRGLRPWALVWLRSCLVIVIVTQLFFRFWHSNSLLRASLRQVDTFCKKQTSQRLRQAMTVANLGSFCGIVLVDEPILLSPIQNVTMNFSPWWLVQNGPCAQLNFIYPNLVGSRLRSLVLFY